MAMIERRKENDEIFKNIFVRICNSFCVFNNSRNNRKNKCI
nr:MAG TPA: hypothetical protein [Caudoviricetes sp.]